ncbi:MAG: prepilin-type N-terminal cleavage/methylation domain-containing protein [Sedimentisphaerales bacterium]
MKSCKHKTGVTLVEILIVVAIIAILVTMVIGVASRIDTQGKVRLTKNTLALLDAALGEFQDYGYEYKLVPNPRTNEAKFYRSLDFPIDCNGLNYTNIKTELGRALGSASSTAIKITKDTTEITDGTYDPCYSGSAVLYFFLNRVPESRQTLDKIDRKLITNLDDKDGKDMKLITTIGGETKEYPLFRFIDPWGKTLRYDYYDYERYTSTQTYLNRMDTKKTFPVITSAGPDGDFNTVGDNITNRD